MIENTTLDVDGHYKTKSMTPSYISSTNGVYNSNSLFISEKYQPTDVYNGHSAEQIAPVGAANTLNNSYLAPQLTELDYTKSSNNIHINMFEADNQNKGGETYGEKTFGFSNFIKENSFNLKD